MRGSALDSRWPEPVFSPEIPDGDLRVLRKYGGYLVPISRDFPPKSTTWNQRRGETIKTIVNLQVMALLALLVAGGLAGAIFNDLIGGLTVLLVVGADVFHTGRFVSAVRREPLAPRTARTYHGLYYCPEDFDARSRDLLWRAQRAASSVLSSAVHRDGLLDRIGNTVVLPQCLWDIAELLHDQTVLRQRQQTASTGIMTVELQAVLNPQRAALDRSVAAVTARVRALEEYSYRVALVESAYQAQRLLGDNDDYVELLARTDDQSAITGLTTQAQALEATLKTSLQAALEAGHTLAP